MGKNRLIMTLKEFAEKYIPNQEGHSEDLEFLRDLKDATDVGSYTVENLREFYAYIEQIKIHPKT